jgi:geranylgeranyl pyrophosphate synthase
MKTREPERKSAVLIKYFQEHSKECQNFVRTSFLSEGAKSQILRKALECYFSYWNDFVHPGFFSLAYEASGGEPEKILKPQAAMAMMAAAFDIHDDIIDGSRRKHDHITVFGKFGQDISLLLGNAFLVNGFALLGDSAAELAIEKEKKVFEVAKECLFEVGTAHVLELETRRRFNFSPERYLKILQMKAASVEADMQIAALMAEGSEVQIEVFKEYGRIIGVLATLREEFVDAFEPEELNRRIHNETLPIPLVYAMKDHEAKKAVLKLLRKGKITKRDVTGLASIILDTEPVVRLEKRMDMLCQRSVELAYKVSSGKSQTLLIDLAQSMLEDL